MAETDPSPRQPRKLDSYIHFFFVNEFVDYLSKATDVKKEDAYVLFDVGEVPGSQADVFAAEYRRFAARDTYLAKKDSNSNALFATLLHVNRRYVTQWIIWGVLQIASRLVLPLIIAFYVREAQPGEPTWAVWVIAVVAIVVALFAQLCFGLRTWASEKLMYNFRYQLPNLIYSKILTLNSSTIANISRGSLINMAIKDMRALDMAASWALYAPASLIEVIVIFIILAVTVSPIASLAGMVMLLLVLPFQVWAIREIAECKKAVSELADERLRLTSEAVQGILTIKSQCWEEPMVDSVLAVRKKEMEYLRRTMRVRVVNAFLYYFFLPVAILLMMIAYSYMDNTLTPFIVFLIVGYCVLPRVFLMSLFLISSQAIYDAKIAMERLNTFMEVPQPPPPPNMLEQAPHLPRGTIAMNGVDYDWDYMLGRTHRGNGNGNGNGGAIDSALLTDPQTQMILDPVPTLAGVQLEIPPGQLLAIAGNVGSGKTSLFAALLGELQPLPPSRSNQTSSDEGGLRQPVVIGSIAYAPQEPWLFAGTVKENILFGLEYDEAWYSTVTSACALTADFTSLPAGDATVLGPGGLGLSGGQKSRVGLARAAYMKADITLLDDPLSSLDARTARHVFNYVISSRGILSNSTRLLATHLRAYFHYCDQILVLREGRVAALGTWDELKGRGIHELNVLSFEDTAHAVPGESEVVGALDEQEGAEEAFEPSIISESIDVQTDIDQLPFQPSAPPQQPQGQREPVAEALPIKLNGFILYLSALGGLAVLFLVFVPRALAESCYNVALYWIAYSAKPGFIDGLDYIIYAILIAAIIVIFLATAFFVPMIFVRASSVLHEDMIRSIFGTHFSFFQSKSGKGSITECVAADVGFTDDLLPLTFYELVVQLVALLAGCVVWIIAIPYIAILIVPFFGLATYIWIKFSIVYGHVGKLGTQTSEHITNSILTAQSGLPIIRTTNSENRLKEEFKLNSIDCAIWNLAGHCCVKWMNVRITYAAVFMALVFVILATALKSQVSYILVGIVLNTMMEYGIMWPTVIRFASTVLAGTQSVERISAFCQLPQEDAEHEKAALKAGEKVKSPDNWPTSALVEFENVSVSYSLDGPLVLRGLSVVMRPGTTVCVIGRTGSGKSTLVLSLFRMVFIRKGTLLFDGIDTATIPLKKLRAQMAIIPQEPVMFSGTIRSNLDPWGLATDDQIWGMLRQVGLYNLTSEMGGLDTPVTENQKISLGQKQLMCLARAFLKDAWLIALDEATASLDLQTEAAVQKTLKSWTSSGDAGRLLLVVAHRLSSTKSADQLLVLSEGLLVENGIPDDISVIPDGYYANMLAAMRGVTKS